MPKALFPPAPEPTVVWDAQGTPLSPRFGDIYRSQGLGGEGGLAQSRHVFLQGCELLGEHPAWRGRAHWTILETGFGLGLNFLASWAAWRADPHRPGRLHFVAVEAFPVLAEDLIRSASPWPELQPLAQQLAQQWWGLVNGVHRLQLQDGQVQLTLGIGQADATLGQLSAQADSIYLDGFSPDLNPDMWSPATLTQVAAHARPGTRLATWSVSRSVRDTLTGLGFQVERVPGLAPKRHALAAQYAPWHRASSPADIIPADHLLTERTSNLPRAGTRCAVVGAGLAGSAVARALAERGWEIQVFEAGPTICSGASGLPAGLSAPHVSQEDGWLSRLTRAGVRATTEQARRLLNEGLDYGTTGVLERRLPHKARKARLPADWPAPAQAWSRLANEDECTRTFKGATLASDEPTPLWHPSGLWLKPARLVAAQLNHPGIRLAAGVAVQSLRREMHTTRWQLDLSNGQSEPFDHVILCAGPATHALLSQVLSPDRVSPLTPVRGQLSWGHIDENLAPLLPSHPVNGDGSFLGCVPDESGCLWMAGSTFDRHRHTAVVDEQDHLENLDRLKGLLPEVASHLVQQLARGKVQAWAGVRCTTPDRLPRVGAPSPDEAPGLHVLTGLGARGLTLSVLCGQWLAAQLCGEPLPLEPDLSRRLLASRT